MMRRFLAIVLVGMTLAGCVTSATQPSNTPTETAAVLGELSNGPAPGLPPVAAGAAIGIPAGPRCYGVDRFGVRVRTNC